jgi:hypothetical protein
MRNRSNVQRTCEPTQLVCGPDGASLRLDRSFRPDELDFDQLAAAVSGLLHDENAVQITESTEPTSDLLSASNRATDVVEAARTA